MIWYLNDAPIQKNQECPVPLGVQGESLALQYTADVSDWLALWPDGVVALVLQPPDHSAPYMADTSLDAETGTITWTVTQYDTAMVGYGLGELRIVDGDVVKKSYRFMTYIKPGILVDADVPPAPVPDWITDLMVAIGEVPDMIEQAQDAADEAEASAQLAADIVDSLQIATVAETKSYLDIA